MPNLKVAVIVDRGHVQRFGLRALDHLEGCDEISVFSCTNTRVSRDPIRHLAYYSLRQLTVRSPLLQSVPIGKGGKRVAEHVEFRSGYQGDWQSLPPAIAARLAQSGFDLIIKLGMGLLRVPPAVELPVPILSWHHGDPERYRGRPAGFWEMAHGTPAMGQVIQVLSNALDAGKVVAFAETKVYPHSYGATLHEAYSHSHLLINHAVRNALAGRALPKSSVGKNYRLPSNLSVVAVLWRMAAALAKRIAYGAFVDKGWQVSVAPLPEGDAAAVAEGKVFAPEKSWRTLPTPRGYLYLADPFFSSDPPGILVEAFKRKWFGEILLLRDGRHQRLSRGPLHLSYPATFVTAGQQLVVPEMAQWGEQRCFRIREGTLEEAGRLDVDGDPRLLDPTLLEHEGHLYLFANDAGQGTGALSLWVADSLGSTYRRHPMSPILISPSGARMAGALVNLGGRLIRFGQTFLETYGDGVLAFQVERLTPDDYRERPIGAIRFDNRQGPHTINFSEGEMVFDWYRHHFSLFAGLRRARGRLRDIRAARALSTARRDSSC